MSQEVLAHMRRDEPAFIMSVRETSYRKWTVFLSQHKVLTLLYTQIYAKWHSGNQIICAPPITTLVGTGLLGNIFDRVPLAFLTSVLTVLYLRHIFGLLTTASSLEDLDDMVQSAAVLFSSPSSGASVEKHFNNLQSWLTNSGLQLDETTKSHLGDED